MNSEEQNEYLIGSLDKLKEVSNKNALKIVYVELNVASRLQWQRNSKKHDIGSISESIRTYGFKDPIKFESSLNEGNGGIVEGNGRLESLLSLKRLHELGEYKETPKGVINNEGIWYVPVLVGVEAESTFQAEAYGIDHNNLTMLGGDFTAYDVAKMWDVNSYSKMLNELAEEGVFSVSMSGDDVDALNQIMSGLIFESQEDNNENDEEDEEGAAISIRLSISGMDDGLVKDVIVAVKGMIEERGWSDNVEVHV